jgi:hypothetical protein
VGARKLRNEQEGLRPGRVRNEQGLSAGDSVNEGRVVASGRLWGNDRVLAIIFDIFW